MTEGGTLMPPDGRNERSSSLQPFRGEFSVVFACEDTEHADEAYQGMIGMLERAGAIVEGGSFGLMDRADVIPLSPLDKALSDA